MYCENCGAKSENNEKFCTKCGSPLKKGNNNNKDSKKVVKLVIDIICYVIGSFLCLIFFLFSIFTKDFAAVLGLLWAFSILPLVYNILLKKTKMPSVLIYLLRIIIPFVIFVIFIIAMIVTAPETDTNIPDNQQKIESQTDDNSISDNNENKNENVTDDSNLNIFGSELKNNFKNACKEINMDYSKIKKLKKIEDWYSGIRYTFKYSGTNFVLYAYEDGEVSAIRIGSGAGISIYDEKYESLNVNDFLVDNGKLAQIQLKAEEVIKSNLNHPDTANFKWTTTGSYARQYNIYSASGELTAKNSFGVKSNMKFYVEINVDDNNVIYLNLDNNKVIGNDKTIGTLDRKEKQITQTDTSNTNSNKITLKMDVLGQYGKRDNYDGEEIIRYYIPAGQYKVKALIKNATFFIEKQAIITDSSGYHYSEEVSKIILSKKDDTQIINVGSDECINLVVNTKIELEKIN